MRLPSNRSQLVRCTQSLAIIATIVGATTCAPDQEPEKTRSLEEVLATDLQPGKDVKSITAALEEAWRASTKNEEELADDYSPPRHRFTVELDGQSLMCMSGWVAPGAAVYLLFRDGQMEKVVRPDAARLVPTTATHEGVPVAKIQSTSVESLPDKIVTGKAMSTEDILAFVSEAASKREQAKKHFEPPPFLPPSGKPSREEYKRYLGVLERFDATKVQVSSSCGDLDALFGVPPMKTDKTGETERRTYGTDARFGSLPVPTVLVDCENGQVKRVFTTYKAF